MYISMFVFIFMQTLRFALTMVTSAVELDTVSDQDIYVTDITTVEMGLMKLTVVSSTYLSDPTHVCTYVRKIHLV